MQNGLISERKPMSCEMNPDGGAVFTLPLFLGTLRLRVLPLACGAVRITRTLREAFLPSGGPAVIPQATGVCTVKEEADSFLADCGSMRLRVCRKTGAVTFLTSEGEILLREDPKHPCTLEEKTVRINRFSDDGSVSYTQGIDGVRASSESFETVEDRTACAYKWRFAFDPEEGLYGLGSHEEGFGNLRGKSRVLYQHNLKRSEEHNV